ncbi:MAG: hypothetical protein JW908_04405 [Anaerolineales bacterium]|nr:hypothetical protein [Anaerolineales bacterium]
MAQSITLAQKYQPILDEIYKLASLTARMDAPTKPVDFAGANVVKVFKTDVIGLGTYSRANGYPKGQIVGTWETLTLAAERGREFNIDRMDDEETLGMAFGTLAGEFMRTEVIPEVDAYRFAKYATGAGNGTTGSLSTAENVLAAIDAAKAALNADEVPPEGRLLYISDACHALLEAALTRSWASEGNPDRRLQMLDGMPVIMVPQARFSTEITVNAGASVDAGGFAATGEDINFMIVHPTAVLQTVKHANLKIFEPDVNQEADAYKVQYRLYHDAFVYDNKADGIYVHAEAESS